MQQQDAEKIAKLNDEARQSLTGCRVFVTQGIRALEPELVKQIVERVRCFDDFNHGNDPYGEHDFGNIIIGEYTVFWKFDYYDLDLEMASLDPTDPTVTARVLTVMMAEEY